MSCEPGINASDLRLPRLISAATAAVTQYLQRGPLHYALRNEKVAGYARPIIIVKSCPVVSIQSIAIDGVVVDSAGYEINDAEVGFIARIDDLWPATVGAYNSVTGDLSAGVSGTAIEVNYYGGWVTPGQASSAGWTGPTRSLPYDIEHAVIQLVVSMMAQSGKDQQVASESLGSYSVSYRAPPMNALPESIAAMLAPHRREVL